MRIIHILFGGAFNEEMSYQGNILPKENKKAGHDVTIITSCYKWNHGKITKVPEEDRITKEGIRLIRLDFDTVITSAITTRIRKVNKLNRYLYDIKPNIILHHDVQGFELFTLAKYKKSNPKVKIYLDSHSDKNNSGSNWVSINLLHKLLYRNILKRTLNYFEKVLYISYEAKDFLREVYKTPESMLEFYPLGGSIVNESDKRKYRNEKREELGIAQDDILLCHSGKMDSKKRTFELLENFRRIENDNIKLILIGVLTEDVEAKVMPIIKRDNRIKFLGWRNSEELIKYIAASDLYVQPGSQSATMQNALCAGTPVLFENVKSHKAYMEGNAFSINQYEEMELIFRQIQKDPDVLKEMSKNSYELARKTLDYKLLADRITK